MDYIHLQCAMNKLSNVNAYSFVRSPILPCRSDGDSKKIVTWDLLQLLFKKKKLTSENFQPIKQGGYYTYHPF